MKLSPKTRYIVSIVMISILILVIFIVDAKPKEFNETFTLSNGNITDHVWSSDGRRIAYVTCPDNQLWSCDLWITDFRFQDSHLIYTGVDPYRLYDWQDDWILLGLSPSQNPYLTSDHKAIVGEIWKIKSDGSELTRISDTYNNGIRRVFGSYYHNIGTVGWAKFVPNTNFVYFSAHDGNGWWGAHLTTDDSSDNWLRIKPGSFSFTIGISPFGETLLWGHSWYWNQPTSIWSSDNHGTNIHHIIDLPVKSSPMVLLDQTTIILSWPGGDIFSVDMLGGGLSPVINDEFQNSWQDYHRFDDKAFFMNSNRDSNANHIFRINSDGSGIFQVTEGNYYDVAANLSPDGHYMSYRRLPLDYDTSLPQPHPYQLVVKDMTRNELQYLMSIIDGLKADDVINKGQSNSLVVKLDHALEHYMSGQVTTARNTLNAFINQVQSLMEEEILTSSQGMYMVNLAASLIQILQE